MAYTLLCPCVPAHAALKETQGVIPLFSKCSTLLTGQTSKSEKAPVVQQTVQPTAQPIETRSHSYLDIIKEFSDHAENWMGIESGISRESTHVESPITFEELKISRPNPKEYKQIGDSESEWKRSMLLWSQLGSVLSARAYLQAGVYKTPQEAWRILFKNHDELTERSIHVSTRAIHENKLYRKEDFDVLPEHMRPEHDFMYMAIYGNTRIIARLDRKGHPQRLGFEVDLEEDIVARAFPNAKQAYEISRHFMEGDALLNLAHTLKVIEALLVDAQNGEDTTPVLCATYTSAKEKLWKSWGFQPLNDFEHISSDRKRPSVHWTTAGKLRAKLNEKTKEFFDKMNRRQERTSSIHLADQQNPTNAFTYSGQDIDEAGLDKLRIYIQGSPRDATYWAEWKYQNQRKSLRTQVTSEVDLEEGVLSLKLRVLSPTGRKFELIIKQPIIKQIRIVRKIEYRGIGKQKRISKSTAFIELLQTQSENPVGYTTKESKEDNYNTTFLEEETLLNVPDLILSSALHLNKFDVFGPSVVSIPQVVDINDDDPYFFKHHSSATFSLSHMAMDHAHSGKSPGLAPTTPPHDPLMALRVLRFLNRSLISADAFAK